MMFPPKPWAMMPMVLRTLISLIILQAALHLQGEEEALRQRALL